MDDRKISADMTPRTDTKPSKEKPLSNSSCKEERLGQALRQNLLRRKAQQRARAPGTGHSTPKT